MESFEIVLWNSELDMRSLRKVVRVKSTPGTAKNACFSFLQTKVKSIQYDFNSSVVHQCKYAKLCFPYFIFSWNTGHWNFSLGYIFVAMRKKMYVYVNRTLIIYWIQDHIDKIKYWYTKKMILHFSCHLTVLPLRSHFKIWQKVE